MTATSVATPLRLSLTLPSVRATARRLTTMHLGMAAFVVLVGGILASALTTSDPLWWQLHFSQLGTFRDSSGAFFNGTLMVGGATVTLYARSVRRDLRIVQRVHVRRGAPLIAQICLTVVGVNLALVGCIPLNTNKLMHDNVAGSMVLGFAALLLSSPVILHKMPKHLLLTTGIVFSVIFAGAWMFVTETINLALFEVIATSAMFAWSGVFTRTLAARVKAISEPGVPADTPAAMPEPRRHLPSGRRRSTLRQIPRRPMVQPVPGRSRTPRRPMMVRPVVLRAGMRAVRAPLPRGRRESAVRAASAAWTTPARRSPRSPAAAR